MMKTIIHLITTFLLACALLSACKDKEEEPKPVPTYARGDRFVGTYRVTDDTGAVYTLKISKFIEGGSQYLRIENLANMFAVINARIDNEWVDPDSLVYNSNNRFQVGVWGTYKDKLNKTWDLYIRGDDSITIYEENYLYGNTIVLYFELSNLPYYNREKTSFHMQFHTHVAIRQ